MSAAAPRRAARLLAGAVGAALVVVGAVLLTRGAAGTLGGVAVWLVAGALLHDALLAPATGLAGAGLARLVGAPGALRTAAVAAVVTAGVLTLVSVPNLVQRALGARNPSVHSSDYPVVLGVVWGAAAMVVLVAAAAGRWGGRREGGVSRRRRERPRARRAGRR